jgi:hypothetical protein
MGYLFCDKCGGYYKLQEGESEEDFDTCQCGGKLRYVDNLDEYINNRKDLTENATIIESADVADEYEMTSKEETMPLDVIYEETVYLTWLIISFILLFGFLLLILFYEMSVIPSELSPLITIVLIIVILLSIFSVNFLILRIKITQEYLSVSAGILQHITTFGDIIECHVDEPPKLKFNGYGIRYGRFNGERVQGYVLGDPKVIISLNKGKYKHFVFTTKNPQEVCKLIKKQI